MQKQSRGFITIALLAVLGVVAISAGVILTAGSGNSTDGTSANGESETPTAVSAVEQANDVAALTADRTADIESALADSPAAAPAADMTEQMDTVTEPVAAEEPVVADPIPVSQPEVVVAGTLTDYDPAKLSDNATNVLFFHAEWCSSCKGLERDLAARADEIPADVNILQLDFDSETALKQQYGVVRQHTLVVVDGNGTEVKKLTGLTNTLDQVVSQL